MKILRRALILAFVLILIACDATGLAGTAGVGLVVGLIAGLGVAVAEALSGPED